ncbi:family 1 glycosylhydrolase [Lysobacter korlensis]|uniref:Family 1 glycosylhydrolase n=1 Tax=Lysobacter korlensis TaxID=553636 RepID=A0ABV6RUF8_9GAMM
MTEPRWFEDGRLRFGLGIENTFVPQARDGERAIDEYELTEHYRWFAEDFRKAAAVGSEFLRWGVPWYRIAPAPGRWDWGWVDQAMESLVEAGLRPIIDLLHYGTPLWLEGEFSNRDYPDRVAEYAHRFAERYGEVAVDYTPVNEPMIHALFSGEYGYWPPYGRGERGVVDISLALAEGFVKTQHAVSSVLGDRAIFVHVDAGLRYTGDLEAHEHRIDAKRLVSQRFLVEDLATGRVGEGHELLDTLRANGAPDDLLAWFRDNAVQPDIMGVNYYPRHSTEVFELGIHHGGGFADPRPSFDAGVEGLSDVLNLWWERYGAPVMLTETCVTGTVEERIEWLDDSVAEIDRLRAGGMPIVGYTWWPLFDMYEWTFRHSSGPRADHLLTMGLFDLVETESGLARRRNPTADRFSHHATAHRLHSNGTQGTHAARAPRP